MPKLTLQSYYNNHEKTITYTALLLGLTLSASAQQIEPLYDNQDYAVPIPITKIFTMI